MTTFELIHKCTELGVIQGREKLQALKSRAAKLPVKVMYRKQIKRYLDYLESVGVQMHKSTAGDLARGQVMVNNRREFLDRGTNV